MHNLMKSLPVKSICAILTKLHPSGVFEVKDRYVGGGVPMELSFISLGYYLILVCSYDPFNVVRITALYGGSTPSVIQ